MKCLITGSRGFIGSRLTKTIREDKRFSTVVGIGRKLGDRLEDLRIIKKGDYAELNLDLTDFSRTNWAISVYKPDIIFHFAGNPTIKQDEGNPNQIIYDNVLTTHNLLYSCLGNCLPRFIYASSAAVYGDSALVRPCSEYEYPYPTSVYGATKFSSEMLLSAYYTRGIHTIILRLVANVGKEATHGLLKDVIKKLKSNSQYLDLIGTAPGSKKPYMYVGDTANATIHLALAGSTYNIFNVSPADTLTVEEVAQIAMQATGIKKEIKWSNKTWIGDNQLVQVKNNKLLSTWFPKYHNSEEAVFAAVREMI